MALFLFGVAAHSASGQVAGGGRGGAADSTGIQEAKPDTIQPPLPRAPLPDVGERDQRWHWDRASLFATGALTVADLLELVPGLTTFRLGWLALPMHAGVAGSVRGVRVFFDGIELATLDPRAGGVFDVSQVQLWSAEDVVIERTAAEVRVHIRSWRVDRTTPYTRADIGTGDVQTNLYRAFFGRRFGGGQAVQFGAQQFGMSPPSFLGTSSDQTGVLARIGWGGTRWSIDASALRTSRHIGVTLMEAGDDSVPSVESTRTDAYIRAAIGDPDRSVRWAQLVLANSSYDFNPGGSETTAPSDTISRDTTRSQTQYVFAAGLNRGSLKLTGTVRLRDGIEILATPSIAASYRITALGGGFGSIWMEGKGTDSISRAGASIELKPMASTRVGASVERITDRLTGTASSYNAMRIEGGFRFRETWITGGVIRRDSASLAPPAGFNLGGDIVSSPAATGISADVDGRVWRSVHARVTAIRWNDSAAFYLPQYQTRSEVALRSTLPKRFPRGNFGLIVAGVHEYRSGVIFPAADDSVVRAPGYRTLSTLLEIRINSAVVSWQFRNVLGAIYQHVPGYRAPRQVNFYGVRWEFWN